MTDLPEENRFVCPRCSAFSTHVRTPLMISPSGWGAVPFTDEVDFEIQGTEVVGFPDAGGAPAWTVTICVGCGQPSVWRGGVLLFPRQSTVVSPHPDMPPLARELFEEARLVAADSRRAAAALVRASLEALLEELAPDSKASNLLDRIGELEGQVQTAVWRVLTVLRIIGNDALHGDKDGLVTLYLNGDDADIVETFFQAINMLVEELITQPRKADEIYALIPQVKREAAERSAKQMAQQAAP